MIGPLNHVGVVVPSIEKAIETYKNLYNATDITEIGEMIDQGVRFCFVNLPNSQIELIEPLGDGSPIQNFLDKNPKGGQHHICFEVKDIHMTDIISGREDLEDVQLLVAVGGFSNSDVLGSAKGWAGSFIHNPQAKNAITSFFEREDTISLGVCNGCQLFIELGLINKDNLNKPKMKHND